MSATSTCPDWCTLGHTLDPGELCHDGPSWADVGNSGEQASVGVGQTEGQPIYVSIFAGDGASNLTPVQAREVACALYEAAAWAEDHSKVAS